MDEDKSKEIMKKIGRILLDETDDLVEIVGLLEHIKHGMLIISGRKGLARLINKEEEVK